MALKDNLVSYWKMDDGANVAAVDSVGAHDLADSASNVGSAAGKINLSRQFTNGTTNSLGVTHNDFKPNGVSFTCALWAKPTDFTIPSAYEYVATLNDTPWKLLLADDSPVQFEWTVTGGTLKFGTAATLNAWHFLVIQWDTVNAVVSFQINNQAPQTASELDNFGTVGKFVLGRNPNDAGTGIQGFTGLIDEVGYWRRLLTTDELTFLYNSGVGKTYEDLSATLTGNLSAKPRLGDEMKRLRAGGFATE